MATNKTQPHDGDVLEFIHSVDNKRRREDSLKMLEIMQQVSGEKPVMWGASIVGFGTYHYKYDSGREGDFFLTGFSPRKQSLSLYIMSGYRKHAELLAKLGKYKTSKACLYVNKLEDIDQEVLKELIDKSVRYMRNKYHS